MAGFKSDEPYDSSRFHIPLAHSTEWYCDRLLPKYQEWKSQANSRFGDKSQACQKFLYHIIPYFVRVVVQDGVYFINEFPNHPLSHYLKVRHEIY